MYKNILFLFFAFLILFSLTACNKPLGGNDFFKKIDSMETSISDKDWQKAKTQWNEFRSYYKDKLWKLQLLGDESEYEGMHDSLLQLEAAINQKDDTQALIELAKIKAYVQQIFTM